MQKCQRILLFVLQRHLYWQKIQAFDLIGLSKFAKAYLVKAYVSSSQAFVSTPLKSANWICVWGVDDPFLKKMFGTIGFQL